MESSKHYFGYAFVLLAVLAVGGDASSWTSKQKERQFKMKVIEHGPEVDWMKLGEPCKNELEHCSALKSLCKMKIIRMKCKDTCGECRAHAPRDCKLSEFGCCWDNRTFATGQFQEGCPVCEDRHEEECKLFASKCDRPDIRTMCPVTCGIKCKTCDDDRHQKIVCPMYKKYGFCETDRTLMKTICKRTCGLCPK